MEHIAAHEDVGVDAGCFELAGEPEVADASALEGDSGGFSLIGVARVAAAEDGDLAAGGLEGSDEFGNGFRHDRRLFGFEAASGEEVAGEVCPA